MSSFLNFCSSKFKCCSVDRDQDKTEQVLFDQTPLDQNESASFQMKHPEKQLYQQSNLQSGSVEPTNLPQSAYYSQSSEKQAENGQNSIVQFVSTLIGRNIIDKDFPKLELSVQETKELQKGQLYQITPQGLVGSQRNAKDGVVIIGTQNQYSNESFELQCADLMIPTSEFGFGPKHLAIYFEPFIKQFYIVDLYQGDGTFQLMEQPHKVQSGNVILFGDTFMQLNINPDNTLTAKIQEGQLKGEIHNFNQYQDQTNIKLGRHSGCNLQVKDPNLSRVHSTIYFQDGAWKIVDGDQKKGSTNGTWLFISEPQIVFDGMVFKAGKTLFKIRIIQ